MLRNQGAATKKAYIGPILAGIAIAVLSVLWIVNIQSIDYTVLRTTKQADPAKTSAGQP